MTLTFYLDIDSPRVTRPDSVLYTLIDLLLYKGRFAWCSDQTTTLPRLIKEEINYYLRIADTCNTTWSIWDASILFERFTSTKGPLFRMAGLFLIHCARWFWHIKLFYFGKKKKKLVLNNSAFTVADTLPKSVR